MLVLILDLLQNHLAVDHQDFPENYSMSFPLNPNHNSSWQLFFPGLTVLHHNAHMIRVTVTRPKLTR